MAISYGPTWIVRFVLVRDPITGCAARRFSLRPVDFYRNEQFGNSMIQLCSPQNLVLADKLSCANYSAHSISLLNTGFGF